MNADRAEVEDDRARAAGGHGLDQARVRRRGRARPRRPSGRRLPAPSARARKTAADSSAHRARVAGCRRDRSLRRPGREGLARRSASPNKSSTPVRQQPDRAPPSASASSWSTSRSCAGSRAATPTAASPWTTSSRSGPSGSSRRSTASTPRAASSSPASPPRRSSVRSAGTSATARGPSACRAGSRRRGRRSRTPSRSCSAQQRPQPVGPRDRRIDRPLDGRRARRARRRQRPAPRAPRRPRVGRRGGRRRGVGVEDQGFEQAEARATLDAGLVGAAGRASA